uniref:hypothetical protein n=1 Tax=uncultured Porphyromonas sp. TaxID=159274 RepID=UPI0026040E70
RPGYLQTYSYLSGTLQGAFIFLMRNPCDLLRATVSYEGKSLNHAFMKAKVLRHDIKWSYIVVRNNRCIKRFCFLPKVFLFGM